MRDTYRVMLSVFQSTLSGFMPPPMYVRFSESAILIALSRELAQDVPHPLLGEFVFIIDGV